MSSAFAITSTANRFALGPARSESVSFTVTNMTGRPLNARARIVPANQAAAGWFTVDQPERAIPVNGTAQFTVSLAVPPDAPASDYSFRLDVINVDNPDEEFALGPNVVVNVPEPVIERRPFPWWIVAVAAAVLLVAIVAAVLLLRDGDEEVTVLAQGAITVTGGSGVDLDSGAVIPDGAASTASDLLLAQAVVDDAALAAQNGAALAFIGPTPPGLEGCEGADLRQPVIPLDLISEGNHICVRTGSGNLAEVRFGRALVFRSFPPRFGELLMTFTTFDLS